MNYYIADTHFGHQNIIRFDNRPFSSVAEMEKILVSNWNNRVTDADTVYILGDFCWGGSNSEWIRLLDILNGSKVLIRGNHDLEKGKMCKALKEKFIRIADYAEISDMHRRLILCHYPILLYKNSKDENTYMLCGHVHTTKEDEYLQHWIKELRDNREYRWDNQGNIINIGCMKPYMAYTPRTIQEIIEQEKKWQ